MRFFFVGMMIAYLGGNLYIFIKALHALSGCGLGIRIIFSILYWVAALALFASLLFRDAALPSVISNTLYIIGSTWLVFTLYMILALIIGGIVRLIMPQIRHTFYWALAAVGVLLVCGYINYLNPQIIKLDISLDKPIEGEPMKIVAISDVHLGEGTGKHQMRRYAKMINSENPDLILIAGDLIDNSTQLLYRDQMMQELAQLKAPMGIYMAPGNHEYISGIRQSKQFLEQTPITLLQDSIITLSNGVQIVGRDDRSNRRRKQLEELMQEADNTRPIIVVDHQPYNLSQSDLLGVDLQLSGHTHRGQIWPISLLTDIMYEQSYGYRKWDHAHIFVSCGLSLWGPPFRIGTSSDMAAITLSGANKK